MQVTATDILAAVSFEAMRIVKATEMHAGGASFPDPDAVAVTIDRMRELNDHLIGLKRDAANSNAPRE